MHAAPFDSFDTAAPTVDLESAEDGVDRNKPISGLFKISVIVVPDNVCSGWCSPGFAHRAWLRGGRSRPARASA